MNNKFPAMVVSSTGFAVNGTTDAMTDVLKKHSSADDSILYKKKPETWS